MHTICVPMRSKQHISPGKIVCIGRNYVAHVKELDSEMPDQMVVFSKPISAITDTLKSEQGESLHYEAELCFLFGDDRFTAVAIGLDLTKRALQSTLKEKGLPWERAKAFDGAALFSDFVELPAVHSDLALELDVDGQPRQRGHVDMMLFKPQTIIDELKTFMRLNNGDVVMSGTPGGVGPIKSGEIFTGRVVLSGRILIEHFWTAV